MTEIDQGHRIPNVRLLPPNRDESRRLMVDDPTAGPVSVRWFADIGHQRWRCRVHGDQDTAECSHTFAAALVLAEQLLGLSRVPELNSDHNAQTTTQEGPTS